jgi:hypothetical protein
MLRFSTLSIACTGKPWAVTNFDRDKEDKTNLYRSTLAIPQNVRCDPGDSVSVALKMSYYANNFVW